MQAVYSFTIIDKYNSNERLLKSYAMEAAVEEQELSNNSFSIKEIHLKLQNIEKEERIFLVTVLGEYND